MKHKSLIADLALIAVTFVWGITFSIIKDQLHYVDANALVFYRFLMASAGMAIFLIVKKKNWRQDIKPGLVLGFWLWLVYVPQTVGLNYTSASNSAFITALYVAFVPLFSVIFFKHVPSVQRLFAALLALIGLWYLTGGFSHLNYGDLLTLLCAVACSFFILLADRYVKKGLDPYVLCFQQFLVVTVLSFLTILILDLPFGVATAGAWGAIVFLAIFATLIAFMVQLSAQRFTSAMKVTLIFVLEPVFAAMYAWTLGGEVFEMRRALGGALVVIAMLIAELPLTKVIKTAV
jgi:drug/metabolite transporter (DMT)-like permease